MPTPSSKPLKPRQRKLQKDRAAGTAKKSAKKAATKTGKTKSATKGKSAGKVKSSGLTKKSASAKKRGGQDSWETEDRPKSRVKNRSGLPKGSKTQSDRPTRGERASATSTKPRTKHAGRPERESWTEDSSRAKRTAKTQGRPASSTSKKNSRPPRPERETWTDDSSRAKRGDASSRPNRKSDSNRSVRAGRKSLPDRDVTSQKISATKPTIAKGKDFETGTTFAEVGVNPKLVSILARSGITEPFAIQTATLPDAISGIDVLGKAQTGSGKTLAFGLAMLTKLAGRKTKARQPLGLILVPTRELAMQVNDALTPLAHSVDLDVRLIAGGMPYKKQIDALLGGVPILVSTPGRLSDLVDQGYADLSKVEIVVLDEADQMCDMGFMPQMVEILDLVPTKGQRLLFSATLDGDVNRLVKAYLRNPVLHETATATSNVATMEHHLLIVERNQKDEILARIAAREGKTIMFVRTQAAADRISNELASVGIPVGALHGGKSQNLRTRTINEFREGVTNVLVATDVAARGIHVDGISLVVHVDPPGDPKDYLHRSGRTARAGDEGKVATLIGARQQRTVLGMMSKVGVTPKVHRVTTTSQELVTVTGAGTPSGKPWKPPKSAQSRGGSRSGGRSGSRTNGRTGSSQSRRKPVTAKSPSRRDSR